MHLLELKTLTISLMTMGELFSSEQAFIWLGRSSYSDALERQQSESLNSPSIRLLGFETPEPTITLGRMARIDQEVLGESTFRIVATDRGGQATLHSPGQLVLFPVIPQNEESLRPKGLVCALLSFLDAILKKEYGVTLENRGDGLYTPKGKMAFIGLRIDKQGVRHGMALNICNDLQLFSQIRSCGVAGAQHDRLIDYSKKVDPEQVFSKLRSSTCNLTEIPSAISVCSARS
jgi:lipoyl(octanoyl) transferase